MNIRLATPQDAANISLLARITFSETFGHLFKIKQELLDYYETTFSVEKIENSLQKKENIYWIAFVKRLPVGYAKLKLNSTTTFSKETNSCQLQKIYVLKDFLSLKIGFELQHRIFEKAVEENYSQIWLSVLGANERAITFYQKNGFKLLGEGNFTIGSEHFDFIDMLKPLP